MRAACKAKAKGMVLAGPIDDGSTLASNSSVAASGIGGSFSRSHSLPDFFVLSCASFSPTMCNNITMSMLINTKTNRPFAARFAMGDTGLVKNNIIMAYLQRCMMDVVPNVSRKNPVVGICDGFGDHISVAVLDFYKKHGIALILRPPHTSHDLQPKDLVNLPVFNPTFHKAKQIRVTKRTLSRMLLDLSHGLHVAFISLGQERSATF